MKPAGKDSKVLVRSAMAVSKAVAGLGEGGAGLGQAGLLRGRRRRSPRRPSGSGSGRAGRAAGRAGPWPRPPAGGRGWPSGSRRARPGARSRSRSRRSRSGAVSASSSRPLPASKARTGFSSAGVAGSARSLLDVLAGQVVIAALAEPLQERDRPLRGRVPEAEAAGAVRLVLAGAGGRRRDQGREEAGRDRKPGPTVADAIHMMGRLPWAPRPAAMAETGDGGRPGVACD